MAFLGQYPGNLPVWTTTPKQLLDQSAVRLQAGARRLLRQAVEDILKIIVHNPDPYGTDECRTECRTIIEQKPNKRRTERPLGEAARS
ncbi:MAG TPA: hypothetical protein VGA01_07160 [Candidatus Binatia bacterium]